jgi:hypothetical protein
MKKISLIALTICASTMVFAQTATIGLKAGANYSKITNLDGKLGYNVGFLANLPVGASVSLQPELVYSNQGGEYTTSDMQKHNLNLNYLNIPVLLQYNAGGVRLQAGPQIGFLTSVHDNVNNVETGFFNKNDFKKIDVSLPVGISYVGRSGIGIDARYNIGLSNINNVGLNTIKNNVAQVGLFMMLK